MIKKNSLRLRNYVKVGEEEMVVVNLYAENNQDDFVDLVDTKNRAIYRLSLSEIDPIALNDEWFSHLGFEKASPLIWRYHFKLPENQKVLNFEINAVIADRKEFVNPLLGEYYYTFNAYWGVKCIKYVHELQNLLFTLIDKDIVPSKRIGKVW